MAPQRTSASALARERSSLLCAFGTAPPPRPAPARGRPRWSRGAGLGLVDGAATPDAVFEREWARALVAGACEVVERELHAAGATDRWEIFARHVLDGRSYDEIARERGCLPADARNATRMVRARIDRALGRMLREEGLPSAEVAEEIRRIHGYFAKGGG
ncbi:MAG: hypothetical protein ACKO0W_13755 [Planctomycetota bacterium]